MKVSKEIKDCYSEKKYETIGNLAEYAQKLEKERDGLKEKLRERYQELEAMDAACIEHTEHELQALKDAINQVCEGNVAIGVDILLTLIK